MRVEDLKNFVAVAHAGSLAAAAQKTGTTQPTLSKSLARLERAVGAPLVERHARGVRLTEAGRAMLSHAQSVENDVRDALAAVRDVRTGRAGAVRIGVGVGIPHALVTAACKPLLEAGALSLEIQGGMSDSLFNAVATGEADFAIVGVRPPEEARLAWTPLFRDPMVAVAHRSHPLVSARSVSWRTLAAEPWIVANVGTMTRAWFEQQFHERGLAPPARMVGLRGYPMAYELGIAISALKLVPASTPRYARDFLDYAQIRLPSDWKSDRSVGVLARSGGYLSPAARNLRDGVERAARKLFRDAAI